MLKKLMLLLIAVSFAQSAHASVTERALQETLGTVCIASGIIFSGALGGAFATYVYDLFQENDPVVADRLKRRRDKYLVLALSAALVCFATAGTLDVLGIEI